VIRLFGRRRPHKFSSPAFGKVLFLVMVIFLHHRTSLLCCPSSGSLNDVKAKQHHVQEVTAWQRK